MTEDREGPLAALGGKYIITIGMNCTLGDSTVFCVAQVALTPDERASEAEASPSNARVVSGVSIALSLSLSLAPSFPPFGTRPPPPIKTACVARVRPSVRSSFSLSVCLTHLGGRWKNATEKKERVEEERSQVREKRRRRQPQQQLRHPSMDWIDRLDPSM